MDQEPCHYAFPSEKRAHVPHREFVKYRLVREKVWILGSSTFHYYLIIMFNHELIRLKNSSRIKQLYYVISYFLTALMLRICVQRFDVTDTIRNFLGTK